MLSKFNGVVCWFDNRLGIGFISRQNNEKDMFVHFSDIETAGFKTLKKGQKVEFSIGKNNRGEDKATEVVVLSDK